MAGTSPRRSIRSRTTQLPHSASHHSSTSSSSSGRPDRTSRHSEKRESPRKQASRQLSSSESLSDVAQPDEDEGPTARRRTRAQSDVKEKFIEPTIEDMPNGAGQGGADDDEAVRCICGFDDYPGPPQIAEEDLRKGIKASTEPELITAADYTEDLAGFFLQCDTCKVWQHGGCVGIKNEDSSPDEYFCEQCRKDLHRIFTASNGQKYSHYLPVYQHLSPPTSRAASFAKDGTRSPRGRSKARDERPTSSSMSQREANARRRATMNSRDAAYEEEQLRKAIEASMHDSPTAGDGAPKRSKRGRSDSEEKQESMKRQRTYSRSPSPSKDDPKASGAIEDSDDEKSRNNGPKKIRGAAARNHREKEAREERERQRLEAATKRKGRAERRRVEDAENEDEAPAATQETEMKTEPKAIEPPPTPITATAPDSPQPSIKEPPKSHKKGGRPPHPRKGKQGKNQYTRDRDDPENGLDSPARSQSRDIGGDDHNEKGPGPGHRSTNSGSKLGRPRGSGSKVSMLDMRRRVAGMLDFISKTQVEMAGEATPSGANGTPNGVNGHGHGLGGASPSSANSAGEATKEAMRGLAEALLPGLNGDGGAEGVESVRREFKDLSLLEMMDRLTAELVKWQKAYA